MEWIKGPRGGLYYVNESGKKVYKKKECNNISNSKRPSGHQETGRCNYRDALHKKVKTCCCCGKVLNESDCRYYDLESYCPRCALADGIITSLE